MVTFSKEDTRAQASIEYIMLVGVSLAIIAILAGYSFVMFSTTISNNQIQTSVKNLQNSINEVYALGEGNSAIVQITLPPDVSSVTLGNKYLLIETTSKSQSLTEFDCNTAGSLPTQEGTYTIEVKNINGVVTLNVVS